MIKVEFLVIEDDDDCRCEEGWLEALPVAGGLVGRDVGDTTYYYQVHAIVPLVLRRNDLGESDLFAKFAIFCSSVPWPLPNFYERIKSNFPIPEDQDGAWG